MTDPEKTRFSKGGSVKWNTEYAKYQAKGVIPKQTHRGLSIRRPAGTGRTKRQTYLNGFTIVRSVLPTT